MGKRVPAAPPSVSPPLVGPAARTRRAKQASPANRLKLSLSTTPPVHSPDSWTGTSVAGSGTVVSTTAPRPNALPTGAVFPQDADPSIQFRTTPLFLGIPREHRIIRSAALPEVVSSAPPGAVPLQRLYPCRCDSGQAHSPRRRRAGVFPLLVDSTAAGQQGPIEALRRPFPETRESVPAHQGG